MIYKIAANRIKRLFLRKEEVLDQEPILNQEELNQLCFKWCKKDKERIQELALKICLRQGEQIIEGGIEGEGGVLYDLVPFSRFKQIWGKVDESVCCFLYSAVSSMRKQEPPKSPKKLFHFRRRSQHIYQDRVLQFTQLVQFLNLCLYEDCFFDVLKAVLEYPLSFSPPSIQKQNLNQLDPPMEKEDNHLDSRIHASMSTVLEVLQQMHRACYQQETIALEPLREESYDPFLSPNVSVNPLSLRSRRCNSLSSTTAVFGYLADDDSSLMHSILNACSKPKQVKSLSDDFAEFFASSCKYVQGIEGVASVCNLRLPNLFRCSLNPYLELLLGKQSELHIPEESKLMNQETLFVLSCCLEIKKLQMCLLSKNCLTIIRFLCPPSIVSYKPQPMLMAVLPDKTCVVLTRGWFQIIGSNSNETQHPSVKDVLEFEPPCFKFALFTVERLSLPMSTVYGTKFILPVTQMEHFKYQ